MNNSLFQSSVFISTLSDKKQAPPATQHNKQSKTFKVSLPFLTVCPPLLTDSLTGNTYLVTNKHFFLTQSCNTDVEKPHVRRSGFCKRDMQTGLDRDLLPRLPALLFNVALLRCRHWQGFLVPAQRRFSLVWFFDFTFPHLLVFHALC